MYQLMGLDRWRTPETEKLVITNPAQLGELERYLDAATVIGVDTETSGTAWYRHARICGVSIGAPCGIGRRVMWYLPCRHATAEYQLPPELVFQFCRRYLEDPTKLKVLHNLKFDEHMFLREGVRIIGPRYDTMIAAKLFNENESAALKYRARIDLKHPRAGTLKDELDTVVERAAKELRLGKDAYTYQYGYSQVPIYLAGMYARDDIEFTLGLWEYYEAKEVSRTFARIWKTEMRLTEVLCAMEEAGQPIDAPYLIALRDKLEGEKCVFYAKVRSKLGYDINLGSDDEVRDLLLKGLRAPLVKTTKGGEYSVDREVLEEYWDAHPVLHDIADWREANKISSTYTSSILEKLDNNGYLHGDFQQVGTDTGRLSCRNPNLQNMAADDNDRAKESTGKGLKDGGTDPWSIRRAFVCRGKGWMRQWWDYSQIELRVLAFYSKDPILVDSYLKGEDVHTRTSIEVFGSDAPEMRKRSKIINFGLSYCMSAAGFSRQTKTPMRESEAYLNKFFEKYHGISEFRKLFWREVRNQGGQFVNIFGRPRRVPHILSPVGKDRGRGERQAIGSLIQGTAAELTKESLVRVYDWFKAEHIPGLITTTIHDEIQIDHPIEALETIARGVKSRMEAFPEFAPIPIIVEGAYSLTDWASKKKLPL